MPDPRLITLPSDGSFVSIPIVKACSYMRITEVPKGDGTPPNFQGILYKLADDSYTQQYQTIPGGEIDLGNALGISGSGIVPLLGLPAQNVPPTYAGGTTYGLADTVTYSGLYYVSRVAGNVGHQPDVSPTQWQAFLAGNIRAGDIPIKCASALLVAATATYILVEEFESGS